MWSRQMTGGAVRDNALTFTGASFRVLNKNKVPQAWLPGKSVNTILRVSQILFKCHSRQSPIYIISHYRADSAEISCWCHLSILGGTQTSLRSGLPTEGWERVDTRWVGI